MIKRKQQLPRILNICGESFGGGRTSMNDGDQIGLQVDSVYDWEEAKKKLDSELVKYSAVLINAQCPLEGESKPEDARNLRRVIEEFEEICSGSETNCPWYVLVNRSHKELMAMAKGEFYQRPWKDESRDSLFYYNTTQDRKLLFKKIADEDKNSDQSRVQAKFPAVFAAIRDTGLDQQLRSPMTELLLPFVDEKVRDAECNKSFRHVRNVIQVIFQDICRHKDIPQTVNLNWYSLVLQGEEDEIKQAELKEKLPQLKNCRAWRTMPKILAQCVKTMLQTCNNSVMHPDNPGEKSRSNRRNYSIEEKEDFTGPTSFLIRSFALQLCDILLWYAEYRLRNAVEESSEK